MYKVFCHLVCGKCTVPSSTPVCHMLIDAIIIYYEISTQRLRRSYHFLLSGGTRKYITATATGTISMLYHVDVNVRTSQPDRGFEWDVLIKIHFLEVLTPSLWFNIIDLGYLSSDRHGCVGDESVDCALTLPGLQFNWNLRDVSNMSQTTYGVLIHIHTCSSLEL